MNNPNPTNQRNAPDTLGLNRLETLASAKAAVHFSAPRTQGKFVAALDDEDIRFVETHFIRKSATEEATLQFLRRWR